MTDSGVVVTERLRDHKIVKPIIYGNTAALLPRKKENNHTHQWTLYLRPFHQEDISKYIRKVQFKLHESYENHVRVLDTPPFEITETGWGEFEVQIKLFFIDVNEKPVTAFYYLRLFQPVVELPDKSKMVVNEYYDEIVFNEPTEQMYRILATNTPTKVAKNPYVDYAAIKRQTKEKLESHNKEILSEIADLRNSLRESLDLIQRTHKELESDSPISVTSSTVVTDMEVS